MPNGRSSSAATSGQRSPHACSTATSAMPSATRHSGVWISAIDASGRPSSRTSRASLHARSVWCPG